MRNKKFFTLREVAELLNLAVKTIRRLVERRELIANKFGGSYRVSQEALDEYIDQSTMQPRKPRRKKHRRRNLRDI